MNYFTTQFIKCHIYHFHLQKEVAYHFKTQPSFHERPLIFLSIKQWVHEKKASKLDNNLPISL